MTDGLDQLRQQREQRKTRSVPPPRNPARTTPVDTPAVEEVQVSDAKSGLAPPQATRAVVTPPASEPASSTEPAIEDLLTKYSIYFDTTTDEFLEAVRVAGRRAKPKLDASRSAVARLAVARLAETLTPEAVLAELRSRAPKQDAKAGRKRF